MTKRFLFLVLSPVVLAADRGPAADTAVNSMSALQSALRTARTGDRILVAPGTYRGTVRAANLRGSAREPIVIAAADAKSPPVFSGRSSAFHLTDCEHVVLRNLHVTGCTLNGINIDDGGSKETPSKHIVLEGIVIENTGPRGNHDALKLSGVDHFKVKDCTVRGWGGSAIDMVGCHDGVIQDCRFEGKANHSQSNAVQAKGGSARLKIRGNVFLNAGQRGINIGGSTGLPYFRPKVTAYEASEVEVADNIFIGSMAPVAWVNADGGHVHHNLVYHPEKWVVRILQESRGEPFLPCRGGVFEDNLVVFDRRVRVFANVGTGTEPNSFTFRRNAWYQSDRQGGALVLPPLPTREQNGIYGVNPMLEKEGTAQMKIRATDKRLRGIGPRQEQP